jgi:phasin family protein
MAFQNPYADAFKLWSEYKAPQMPQLDVNNLMNFGKRNVEAVTLATQAVTESVQSIARRQAEMARSNVETVLKTTKDMLVGGSPEVNTSKQVELAKTMFENSLNNVREVCELSVKCGFEAFDELSKRASQNIDELTQGTAKRSTKKANA